MKFRDDINGLRAIAVIAVVLFHFRPDWLPGGFTGVDVFFVISGYLMTAIIFGGLKEDSFSLKSFYISRGRRIVPALMALCLALLIYGWVCLLPSDFEAIGKHVAASLGFISNVVYWREAGYFSALTHEKWLLHTWSLSVEWQFYLLYPLALILISKFIDRNRICWVVLIGSIVGYLFSIYASYNWPTSTFYLLPARAWEMLVGGVAFFFPITFSLSRKIKIELIGFFLILSSFLFITTSNVWPSYLTILPVLGVYLIILASRDSSILTSNFVFKFIGKISYSVYLWHWPIVVYGYGQGQLDDEVFLIVGLVLSVVLGYFSYLYIERGVWAQNKFSALFVYLSLGFVSVFVFISDGVVTELRPASVSAQASFYAKYDRDKYLEKNLKYYKPECNFFDEDKYVKKNDGIAPICTKKTGDGGVFLWGDSHAQSLSYGLVNNIPSGVPFYQVATSGCGPRIDVTPFSKGEYKLACDESNNFAIRKIREVKPSVVIMAQRSNHELTDFDEIGVLLKSYGVDQVILVGPVPQWLPSLPNAIVKRHWDDANYIDDIGFDKSVFSTDEALKKMYAANDNVEFVSLVEQLCLSTGCLAKLNEASDILVWDYGHLTTEGSLHVIKNIVYPRVNVFGVL